MPRWPLVCALALTACADPGSASLGDDLDDPQLPPRGSADLDTWLTAGKYLTWRCEPAAHAGRSPSPHGASRICNNDALSASTTGPFPVGAAAVKEIFNGTQMSGYAVARKLTAGTTGDGWYWYEDNNGHLFANAIGVSGCTGCHAQAHDYVFTIVP
jgi:hypothetical protein